MDERTQDKTSDRYHTELNLHMATSLKGQKTHGRLEKYLQSRQKVSILTT